MGRTARVGDPLPGGAEQRQPLVDHLGCEGPHIVDEIAVELLGEAQLAQLAPEPVGAAGVRQEAHVEIGRRLAVPGDAVEAHLVADRLQRAGDRREVDGRALVTGDAHALVGTDDGDLHREPPVAAPANTARSSWVERAGS